MRLGLAYSVPPNVPPSIGEDYKINAKKRCCNAKISQNAPESAETNAKNMARYILGPKLYYRGHVSVVYVFVMQFMLLL